MSAYELLGYIRLILEFIVASPVILWVLYFLVMKVKKHHLNNKYKPWEYLYAGPLVVTFYLVDVFVNYTFASLALWEWPKSWKEEKLVSERLTRYHLTDHGWRTQVTAWIGPLLLDRWDPDGKHIGNKEA